MWRCTFRLPALMQVSWRPLQCHDPVQAECAAVEVMPVHTDQGDVNVTLLQRLIGTKKLMCYAMNYFPHAVMRM
jgi:hypothetical protein